MWFILMVVDVPKQVNAEDKLVSEFLDSNDFGALDRASNEHTSDLDGHSSSDVVSTLKVVWRMKTSVPMLQKTRKDTSASPHLGIKLVE